MAVYRGYVKVAHSTYDEWKSKTLNNSYDVDFAFGYQCWDYVALLYWQYGLTLVTKVGGGSAKDCWLRSKNANAKSPFIAVEGVQNIKRGDIIVTGGSSTGHICFADQDYSQRNTAKNSLQCLGQNQGKSYVRVSDVSLNNFLGIFRNTKWSSEGGGGGGGGTVTTEGKPKRKFPWPVAWQHWNY